MPGPLSGYKIIDLTTMISGPLATMILADQGAEVIKVEIPNGGDFSRHVATRRGGFSASFLNNNRNKRSISLDLKTEQGVEILTRLIETADVLVQNFRPGVADRMGIGYEAMADINPGLVYMSISGFGFNGPYAGKRVFDPLIQSLSGLTTVQAGSDEHRPRLVRTILPDKLTGFTAAQAICASLLARHKSGRGEEIRLSMLDTVLHFLWSSDMGGHTFVGDELESEVAQSFIDLIYETKDSYMSVAIMRHTEWVALAKAVNRPEWLEDERFQDTAGLEIHKNERLALTQEALKQGTTAEWLEKLQVSDVPCAPVLARREVIRHAQVKANEILIEVEHPQAGRLRQTRTPAVFSSNKAEQSRPAPGFAEHTKELLSELGLEHSEIDELIRTKVAIVSDPEGS
ncbi:MAG: CoA transferase [Pseudomonadota bacterium]